MKENELIGCYVHVFDEERNIHYVFRVLGMVGTDSYLLQAIDVEGNPNYSIVRDIEWIKKTTIVHPNEITEETMDKLIANIAKYDVIFKTL